MNCLLIYSFICPFIRVCVCVQSCTQVHVKAEIIFKTSGSGILGGCKLGRRVQYWKATSLSAEQEILSVPDPQQDFYSTNVFL